MPKHSAKPNWPSREFSALLRFGKDAVAKLFELTTGGDEYVIYIFDNNRQSKSYKSWTKRAANFKIPLNTEDCREGEKYLHMALLDIGIVRSMLFGYLEFESVPPPQSAVEKFKGFVVNIIKKKLKKKEKILLKRIALARKPKY